MSANSITRKGNNFVWKGAWVTSTAYAVNDSVQQNGSGYICLTAHTSGTFATDLAAGKWSLFVEGVGGNSIQVDCSGGTSDTYGALSGLVNSSNTVYTVSLGAYVSGSLKVYLNGQLQTQGSSEDWVETTPASGTFTFATAPATGDIIIATYQYASSATGNADTLDGLHASSLALNSEWQNGWISAGETWTYASATTFTISGDKTSKYQKGDKIKLTQTTAKYFYIIAISYSSPNTTVTVTGGSDYTLANAAITSPYFSKVENPQGLPASFNYTPTITGFTSNPTVTAKFKLSGTVCTVNYPRIEGTSNAATVTVTLPITPANSTFVPVFCLDNGNWISTEMAYFTITGGNATATAYKNLSANFTASGDKKIAENNMTYLI